MLEIINLAKWEWFRLRKQTDCPVLGILCLLIPVLVLAVSAWLNQSQLIMDLSINYFEAVTTVMSAITPALAIVLAAIVHAADLQGGNCRTLAARGNLRSSILAAKALTVALVLLAYHLIAYLMAGLPALVWEPRFEGWDTGIANAGAAYLNSLLYLALGIALSHWRQSTAFTIGIGIGLIALEAIAYPLAGLLGELLDWPLAELTAWSIRGVAQGLQGQSESIARAWYIPIVAGYAAILAGAALTLFRKFDLRPGGD